MTALDPKEFLYTGNQVYIAEMFERFMDDPGSVDPRWQDFFAGLTEESPDLKQERKGASWAPSDANILGHGDLEPLADRMTRESAAESPGPSAAHPIHSGARVGADKVRQATLDSLRALMLIRSYRVRGHLLAKVDPLELDVRKDHPELNPATYGFQDSDMDREIFINYVLGLEAATLREIMSILHQTYCGSIGIEYEMRERKRGKSNNSLYDLIDMSLNAFVSFGTVPMRLCLLIGFGLSLLSILVALFHVAINILYFREIAMPGIPTLTIALFFFSGVQLFFIGILGEYVLATHSQVRRRPFIVERRRINFDEEEATPKN